jgi:hypothetical protein
MSDGEATPSEQIDAIISNLHDWRGETLSELRTVIRQASSDLVEEVKWKKPSKPEGVAVWAYNGNICIGEALKNAVRLTFPKGAELSDPQHLFNTRLDSKTVRAVDFFEDSTIDTATLTSLILEAMELQASK